jgi:hypothetical protein
VEDPEETEIGLALGGEERVQRHMLPAWATKPEMIVTYFLFVLAALISIYSSAIRGFITILLTVPPSKVRRAYVLDAFLLKDFSLEALEHFPGFHQR